MSKDVAVTSNGVNEIVVYQPDDVLHIEVKLQNDTVWLTQAQMAELFSCTADNISLHLKNIFSCGELDKKSTSEESSVVQNELHRSNKIIAR